MLVKCGTVDDVDRVSDLLSSVLAEAVFTLTGQQKVLQSNTLPLSYEFFRELGESRTRDHSICRVQSI